MKKILIIFLFFLLLTIPAFANNLTISNVTIEDRNASANTMVVQFNISWDHSWRKNDGRHDAAWVFVKLYQNSTAPWIHGKLYTAGTNPTGTSSGINSDLKIVVPTDKIGAFISRTATGNGTFSSQKVRLVVDYGSSGIADTDTVTAKVFGIEMTYIPEGPFYIGGDTHDLNETVGVLYQGADAFVSVFNSGGTFQWSRRLGGTSDDSGNGLGKDSSNNIIVVGAIIRNADLNGDGDTADSSESTGGVYSDSDAFISVFNSAGTFQWSRRIGGTGSDFGNGITINSANNLFEVGLVSGNADLNGDGDTSDSNESTGGVYSSNDAFISVFNSAGTFQWSERLGGTGSDYGNAITTDSSNRIILTGRVSGSADLNGDGDTADTSESTGGVYSTNDAFISVFNSSGTFQWAKRLGGTASDNGYALTTDSFNNVVFSGLVNGNVDLNGDGDTADTNEASGGVYSANDAVISVFNSSGTFQWSKRLGGTTADSGYALTADSVNKIIVVGQVFGNADLNGDGDTADTSESTGGVYSTSDAFISVFSSDGTFQWAKRLGGTDTDESNAVTTDSANNVIISGDITGNADLNGDGDTNDTNETGTFGVNDSFVSVFNSAGTFQWSKRLGGTGADIGYGIVADNNNIISTGYVTGSADLNGDGGWNLNYAFYQSGYEDEPVQITTTGKAITVNTNSCDDIDSSPVTVTGLAGVTGNTSWPNGYAASYMMKYELTQGQYKDFLNSLTRAQQINRVQATISGNTITNYYVMADTTSVTGRQGIRAPASGNGTTAPVVFGCDLNGNGTFDESDDGLGIGMNYINWMDYSAYADWAGLRPITDLEYEKSCRGSNSAVYGEYAWGTTTITQAQGPGLNLGRGNEVASTAGLGLANYDGSGTDMSGPFRVGFAATNATNRISAGAGYYGAMELTGNVDEFAVPLGNSSARAFQGTHGDGTLTSTTTYEGNATNNDWLGINATTARGVTGDGVGSAHSATYLGGSWSAVTTVSFGSVTGRTYCIGFGLTRRYSSASGGRFARTAP